MPLSPARFRLSRSSWGGLAALPVAALALPILMSGPASAADGHGNPVSPLGSSARPSHSSARVLPDASTTSLPARGTVYVADFNNSRVVAIAPDGTESTVVSGFATYGVAVDAAGDVFATDMNDGTVVKVAPDGTQSTVATDLSAPVGIALDATGNLYVSGGAFTDPYVTEIAPDGTQTPIAFTGLQDPLGVDVDAAGDVFVADPTVGAVLEITPAGVQSTVATGFGFASGVAVDADGNVFVADQLDSSGITKVTPDGTKTPVPLSGLNYPDGVATDAAGNAYVASYQGTGVYRVAPDGTQTTVASDVGGYSMAVYDWKPQTISFTSTPTRETVGKTYQVTATGGDSGEPVVYSTDPSSTGCTVTTDGTVTMTHAQDCVIAADQAGADGYAAAPQATQSFEVGRGSQKVTITSTAPKHPKVGGTYHVQATGGASERRLRISVRGSCTVRQGVVTFTHVGRCSVVVNQKGSADWLPASAKQVIKGIKRS